MRGIIRKLTPEKKEIEVPGYTKEQVEEAFSQLIAEGIVSVFLGEIYEVRDLAHLKEVFKEVQPEIVLHLAAQPIVRDVFKQPINVVSTGEKIEMQDLIDSQKLAKLYGIDSVGNDI